MRIQGIVLAVFALATPVCADEVRQGDTTVPIVETNAHGQQASPYQLRWQRRLIEVQTAFAATLNAPVDRVETGSIIRSDQ